MMIMSGRSARFSTLCLLLCWAHWCAAGSDHNDTHRQAKDLLNRMIQATRTQNYQGTFVYTHGQTLEVMHITHNGASGRQRMLSLNGPTREVMVENNQVTCLLPSQQVAFNAGSSKRSPFPISLPDNLETLESNYLFSLIAEDRVAGRETRVVAIKPRDHFRFGYQLWLDKETDLVLRSALFDEKHKFLEQLVFTEIDIRPDIEVVFFSKPSAASIADTVPALPAQKSETSPPGKASATASHWQMNYLPSGFKQILEDIDFNTKQSTDHWIFSDGLANVSVFIEPLDDNHDALLKGSSNMDAMNAYGIVINQHQVIVMGEVPLITVEKIARSITYQP